MKRHGKQDYVPDFLQDSPFLPILTENDKFSAKKVKSKTPTFAELLRHRRTRKNIVTLIIALVSLYCLGTAYRTVVLRWFSGPRCLQTPPITPPVLNPDTLDVDWSQYAYTQYATNTDYLCNSVMIFEALHRLNSKADRLLLYPSAFSVDGDSIESKLLSKAKNDYAVKLVPVEIQRNANAYRKQYYWLL
jgi:hypothetical protein